MVQNKKRHTGLYCYRLVIFIGYWYINVTILRWTTDMKEAIWTP